MNTLLIVLLVVLLLGGGLGGPRMNWNATHYSGWGIVLIVLLILIVTGRLR